MEPPWLFSDAGYSKPFHAVLFGTYFQPIATRQEGRSASVEISDTIGRPQKDATANGSMIEAYIGCRNVTRAISYSPHLHCKSLDWRSGSAGNGAELFLTHDDTLLLTNLSSPKVMVLEKSLRMSPPATL